MIGVMAGLAGWMVAQAVKNVVVCHGTEKSGGGANVVAAMPYWILDVVTQV